MLAKRTYLKRDGARQLLTAAMIAIPVGAAMIFLGISQLAAALLQYRAAAVVVRPQSQAAAVSADELRAAIERLDAADRWWEDPDNSFNSGLLAMRLAAPTRDDAAYDRALLFDAERRFERSLAHAPANAQAWAALADARRLDDEPSRGAAALTMSMQLARYEPSLLAWRCKIGLALYPMLDERGKNELAGQIRALARLSTDDLIRLARATGRIRVVITALSTDSDVLSRFERGLHTIR